MTADIHTLTGAYVLHALTDDERAAFETHMAQCPSCQREVSELRETASRLGSAVAAEPPESLRSDVLDRINRVRQMPPEDGGVVVAIRRRRWPLWVTSIAAAAAMLAAVALGAEVVSTQRELDRAEGQRAELVEVLAAADSRLRGTTNGSVVVSQRLDKLAFLPRAVPPPPAGKAYQMWFIGPQGPRSAGLMTDPASPVVTDLRRGAEQFGVTVEPRGGSQRPTTKPVLLVRL